MIYLLYSESKWCFYQQLKIQYLDSLIWDGLDHPSLNVSKCKLPLMTGQGKNCLKVLRHLRKFPSFHSQVCQQQPQQYFVDAP